MKGEISFFFFLLTPSKNSNIQGPLSVTSCVYVCAGTIETWAEGGRGRTSLNYSL